jgi:phosphoglycolate phosphatase-like HAD superfamily hydrolase
MCAATSNSRTLAEGALKNLGLLNKLEFVLTMMTYAAERTVR